MKFAIPVLALWALVPIVARAEAGTERALSEALRDAHDRGAEMYNSGETAAAYRVFQGALYVARGMLNNRPDLQKLINTGMADAEREPQVAKRAFYLHELIEKVRADLHTAPKIAPPKPREVPDPTKEKEKEAKKPTVEPKPEPKPIPKPEPKPEPKPVPKPMVSEAKDGVVGRVLFQGKPVAGAEVMFVSVGRLSPVVFEAVTGAQGTYQVPNLPAGKYVITLTAGQKAEVKKLPERYSTTSTSPLRFDVKAGGEKLDFLLD